MKGALAARTRMPRVQRGPDGVACLTGDPVAAWGAFTRGVAARLEKGRAVYGGRSFSRDPAALAGEVGEELLDVAGWAFVLWTRLEAIRRALGGGEAVDG